MNLFFTATCTVTNSFVDLYSWPNQLIYWLLMSYDRYKYLKKSVRYLYNGNKCINPHRRDLEKNLFCERRKCGCTPRYN